MKQTASFISTYSADVFGVCSALFELGGMTIMHDASGCNSTYSTHDEPRWFDHESMVYISGISEMEAIMGDDNKLINDIVRDAAVLKPKFIAIAGTPIPAMTGFDFNAVAGVIEAKTGIPTFGFATTGMDTYIKGASMAFEAIVSRFAERSINKTEVPSANVLGLTPLDFSVNGEDASVSKWLKSLGFKVVCPLAMGSTLENVARMGSAHVSLVVSACGLAAAKTLERLFGIPYVVGLPVKGKYSELLAQRLYTAAQTGKSFKDASLVAAPPAPSGVAVIGEGVRSLSLAESITLQTGLPAYVVCPTEDKNEYMRPRDICAPDEDDIVNAIKPADTVIADPLFKPIVGAEKRFIALPHEAFSGRIFRSGIPDIVRSGFEI